MPGKALPGDTYMTAVSSGIIASLQNWRHSIQQMPGQ
jgi:hypothetical protein